MIDAAWRITLDASDDEAYAFLQQDRIWNCFALADLLPPFRQYTQIAIASHAQTGQVAICLLIQHPQVNVIAPNGHAEGVAALLARLDLPGRPLIQTPQEHLALFESYYRLPLQRRALLRMAVSAQTFHPAEQPSAPGVEYLKRADVPALRALYSVYPENHFRPALVEERLFYGIREGNRIVAAGGTHVIALPYGLAVLGNILTHHERRGRGYAQAITSALVTELLAQGCQDVILNVDAENDSAIHVYTKLGFQPHGRLRSTTAERFPQAGAELHQ